MRLHAAATGNGAALTSTPRPRRSLPQPQPHRRCRGFQLRASGKDQAHAAQARKEGNPDVSGKLEQVMKIAMDEKQKTLRPEIQLLNSLLACRTREERRKVYEAPDTLDRINDYFRQNLLDRMIGDVKRRQASPNQAQLLRQLLDIKAETERVVAQAS